MVKLERQHHGSALALYRAAPARFPLVGAVLLDDEEGVVFVDDAARPGQAYVEHAFGFAQLLGEPNAAFESALARYLLVDKSFAAPKIRLYTPRLPDFLEDARYHPLRSLRQRFTIDRMNFSAARRAASAGSVAVLVDESNVDAFEHAFGVVRRFWRSASDFVAKAHGVVVMRRGEPASICYAAAVTDGEAEIDVLTRPEHQRLGLGKVAVVRFVELCFEKGVTPLWDCFANNAPSVELSRAIGFTPKGAPYPFFTINK